MDTFTLDKLGPAQVAIIVNILGQGPVRRRLIEMGVVPGNIITMVRFAPLGDPLEYRLQNSLLSLRKEEASRVVVRLKEQGDENHE